MTIRSDEQKAASRRLLALIMHGLPEEALPPVAVHQEPAVAALPPEGPTPAPASTSQSLDALLGGGTPAYQRRRR